MTTTAIRDTALFHAHERAGASFTEYQGWRVPAYYAGTEKEAEQISTRAALSDVSWMTKLDLKGNHLRKPPVLRHGRAWVLGQRHYLITCGPSANAAVTEELASFSSGDVSLAQPTYITDVTSVYAQFLLAGPHSRHILRKLTSLNVHALENLRCGQASFAHVHSTVLRDDLQGIPAFHILVSRDYGESVWGAILHAGHEFQLSPFGLQALQGLGGQP